MEQLLIWIVVLAVIGLVFWAIVRENDRLRNRTVEEYERDFAAGRGKTSQFIRAGALGLESILMQEKREAIAYQKDEEQGMTKTGGKDDDVDRTESRE